jgi:hypothetical protein
MNQADGYCQFGFYRNELGGDAKNLLIIGEPLLKHLYIVYDFENDEIKLGVNVESANEIKLKSTELKVPSLLQGDSQETSDLIKNKPSTAISKSDEEWDESGASTAKPSFDKVKNQ